jgi:hypothetical protein
MAKNIPLPPTSVEPKEPRRAQKNTSLGPTVIQQNPVHNLRNRYFETNNINYTSSAVNATDVY